MQVRHGLKQQLQQLKHVCVDFRPFFEYVKDTWLTLHRHRFCEARIDKVLHLGNTVTNRAALRHIPEEWLRVDMVGTNTQMCRCNHRKVYKLPCACEQGRYTLSGEPIPIDDIHIHWRKLSMEGEQEVDTEDGEELDMTNSIDALCKRFRLLDVARKRALKIRVCEIFYPTTTNMCPPPEKIKTKKRVKRKGKKYVGYDVYRDPSYHEYVYQAQQFSKIFKEVMFTVILNSKEETI
ncbi:unnamed protein product [Lathyrus sativus]|nr:unnamed protein product [Lathyrus sativus]